MHIRLGPNVTWPTLLDRLIGADARHGCDAEQIWRSIVGADPRYIFPIKKRSDVESPPNLRLMEYANIIAVVDKQRGVRE
jgi:hypothetical protein